MSEHNKFEFATVFTPGAPHPDDDPHAMMDPADIPVYSQNQLDAALAEARDEGSNSATEMAAQNADAVANQILTQIQDHFARLGTFQDSIVSSIHAEAVELAMLVGQKLARALMTREPKAEVEALILELLQQHSEIGGMPRITVRVHPVVAADITARIEILKNNAAFGGEVTVLPAESLGPTDCAVEWADGGAERDLKELEQSVTEAIQRYLSAIHEAGGVIDETPETVVAASDVSQAQPAPVSAPAPAPQADTILDAPQQTSVIDEIVADATQAATVQDQVS